MSYVPRAVWVWGSGGKHTHTHTHTHQTPTQANFTVATRAYKLVWPCDHSVWFNGTLGHVTAGLEAAVSYYGMDVCRRACSQTNSVSLLPSNSSTRLNILKKYVCFSFMRRMNWIRHAFVFHEFRSLVKIWCTSEFPCRESPPVPLFASRLLFSIFLHKTSHLSPTTRSTHTSQHKPPKTPHLFRSRQKIPGEISRNTSWVWPTPEVLAAAAPLLVRTTAGLILILILICD